MLEIPVPGEGHSSLDVVVPVYQNADTLIELKRRLCAALDSTGLAYEIIFVDDACPQSSLDILKRLAAEDRRVSVLALSRNMGQQFAVRAGLCESSAPVIAILDADLQDPPEALPGLLARLTKGYEVVFAGRAGKYESGERLLTSRLYKFVLHLLTGLPRDAGLFMVAQRQVVERLLAMQVPRLHLVAMIGVCGACTTSIPVTRSTRPIGVSAMTSRMRLRLGLEAIAWVLSRKLGFRPGRPVKSSDEPPLMIARYGSRY